MLLSYDNTFHVQRNKNNDFIEQFLLFWVRNKLLNKTVIFVFFMHKKYSRCFITLRLNHWCHMDYFNDVLTTFLGLELVDCIAVYAESDSESSLIS